MNFFLFFAVGFDLCLPIFQLVSTIILLLFNVHFTIVDCYNCLMPVTTRSQSKRLTQSTIRSSSFSSLLTSSFTKSSEAKNLLTNSSRESSKVTLTSTQLSSVFHDNINTTTLDSILPAPNISMVSNIGSFPDDVFKNLEFQNLTFQNSSIPNSNTFTTTLCHNFGLETCPIMESDCEDLANHPNTFCETMDVSDLIKSLSQQISSQMTFIQDQLTIQNSFLQERTNSTDLKIQSIIQDNEDFKQNVKQELEGLRQFLV